MNYANMIEEKNLKKGFIVATLVSTIVGTFTASMTLHDKIQERREAKKQKATDSKQDDEIKALREEMKMIESARRRSRSSSPSQSRSSGRRRRRRREDDASDDERFARSAWRSRAMIEEAYEDNLRRLGNGYAQGDLLTENQLQAQIIQLQSTVINVLQDALYNGRQLTQADVNRLIEAQTLARTGSLDALQGQYTRMQAARRQSNGAFMPLERATTTPLEQKQLAYTATRHNSLPLAAPKLKALPAPTPHLFCGYAEQLQMTSRALSPAFDAQSDGCCPACGVHIPVDTQDFWTLTVQVPDASGRTRPIDYEFDARLIVKSHMEDGRFACVLCNKLSSTDCLCRDVDALVQHLGKMHNAEDYHIEPDLIKATKASFSRVESQEMVLR